MEHSVKGMEKAAAEIKEAVERISGKNNNVNTVRIEGVGSIWNGLAVGVALGAVIVGGAWIISTQQRLEMIAQQSEAYSKAVYMLAPRFAEEIDKELSKKEEPK